MRLTVARVKPTLAAIAPCLMPSRASANTSCLIPIEVGRGIVQTIRKTFEKICKYWFKVVTVWRLIWGNDHLYCGFGARRSHLTLHWMSAQGSVRFRWGTITGPYHANFSQVETQNFDPHWFYCLQWGCNNLFCQACNLITISLLTGLDIKTTMYSKIGVSYLWIWSLCLVPPKFIQQATINHHGPSMFSGHYTTPINCCQKCYCNDSNITEFEMIDTKSSSTAIVAIYKWMVFVLEQEAVGYNYSHSTGTSPPSQWKQVEE